MAYQDGDVPNKQLREGTRADILLSGLPGDQLSHHEQWYLSKVFNGLDNACPEPLCEMPNFRSIATHEQVLLNNDLLYGQDVQRRAIPHLSWATVASRHSISDVHLDADGLGTVSHPLVGRKLWVILTLGDVSQDRASSDSEKEGNDLIPDPRNTDSYYRINSLSNLNLKGYTAEAILLGPGQTFYQRPNQLHWVYGVDPTIVYGRHFYASHALPDSLYGQVHTQLMGYSITNAAHAPVRLMLGDFMSWWLVSSKDDSSEDSETLPDLEDERGMETFIAMSNAVVFSWTLCCVDGEVPDPNDADGNARRIQNMVSYLALMKKYIGEGYGAMGEEEFREKPYDFFKHCNIHFAKAMLCYSEQLDFEDWEAGEGKGKGVPQTRMASQQLYEVIRRDLGRMWGPTDGALTLFDEWYMDEDGNFVAQFYPPVKPRWNAYRWDNVVPEAPEIPINAQLQPKNTKRGAGTDAEGSRAKRSRKKGLV
ncbi:hypothetical protein EVG20_g6318, partial [Dentipellis fragilis]